MKILKPGNVEQRKFVCPECECIFVCDECDKDTFWDEDDLVVPCPTCGGNSIWANGEPYEEPTPTQTDRERLIDLLDCNFGYTDDVQAATLADKLIANGVTFREGEYGF